MTEPKRKQAELPLDGAKALSAERLADLYEALSAPLPEDAIQATSGKATGKGYDTAGYGYQFVADRLNEILGPAGWRTVDEMWVEPGPATSSGRQTFEAICRLTLHIGLPEGDGWRVLASRTCYGGHLSTSRADAQKGAFTNAFKKTAALFGIGRQAYEGALDEDQDAPEGGARPERRSQPVDRTAEDERTQARRAVIAAFTKAAYSIERQRDIIERVTGRTSYRDLEVEESRLLLQVLDRINAGDDQESVIAAARRAEA